MSERSIFLNALDREDPAARAAYLDEACAGRPELRRRIERLLRAHQMEGAFLEVPAPEQLAGGDQALPFLAPPREPGALGRLDHYEVLEVVGRGATGVVLKARDAKLQRVVALKVLAPRLAASGPARERFVREAQATATVRDDRVFAIHAVCDDGPLPYLVMEYIDGVTLEGRINKGGPLELPEILRIGLQAAAGLAAAHAQGLIHRDIKPANILLENGVQRVKLTDFGLACAAADAGLAGRGVIAGTPPYMAPCQARGEPASERSDLFSLGAVLYTLCTGRPPFGGDTTAAVLKSVCEDAPRPIRATRPDLPEAPCNLIGKLLAKDPKDRFGSAREVADWLTGRLAREQQSLPPPSPVAAPTGPAPAGSRFWRACLLVAGLSVLLAGLAALAAVLKPWQRGAAVPGPGDSAAREGRPPAESLDLRREDIPPTLLALAGGGDPTQAPPELVEVLGDEGFLLPRIGAVLWMQQSPDEKILAAPLDEDLVLFEAQTGKYLRTLKGPGGTCHLDEFQPRQPVAGRNHVARRVGRRRARLGPAHRQGVVHQTRPRTEARRRECLQRQRQTSRRGGRRRAARMGRSFGPGNPDRPDRTCGMRAHLLQPGRTALSRPTLERPEREALRLGRREAGGFPHPAGPFRACHRGGIQPRRQVPGERHGEGVQTLGGRKPSGGPHRPDARSGIGLHSR
jgi:tRNA A-37 threonylcarbamoyl transferase component Bud32